ncbi:hypothetical protein DCS_05131 [Drechmeria coniospora]|uniref:polynucleotide adenylyltransferase n=1 Tax=Drechmeria coniospora TaxID=98403 RepID=A0A151GM16_DRECN|nr:hypothetical protein DCS_05131 [Drechmeria coniospora]KYK58118.1 hypothetical protein DCS_05131 [Drechmeria coniospora]
MDARASADPHHPYLSNWPAARVPTTTPATDGVVGDVAASSFPPHLDFLPFIFPQQANIYHAQLLHYQKLVSPSRGGGLQTPPLPPVVSLPHVPSARSRSSSRVLIKDVEKAAGGHGSRHHDKRVTTAKDPSRMPKQQPPADSSRSIPKRMATSTSSSSVPSTPHQHARKFSFESRDPSPTANGHSPRSAYSETSSTLPSLRPLPPRLGGCRYETAQINSRRRIPYSVGNDRLEKLDLRAIKSTLSESEEKALSADIRDLYDRLLPTDAVEENRKKLVGKLERIFNDEWPGHDIRVHPFGSSGNLLCSDDSDVDICITTSWHELEAVCKIAHLLAQRGMEKVVCISAAKVPIVKMWDPELSLACDMNVNNTLALENTRMVRTYVEADPRVRQLAMIIKFWTRRRIVNDAAFGGTLSSYTWICLIIAFLQLRDPPVLPALHQLPFKMPKPDGSVSEFADNLKRIKGFGAKNKSSVSDLLFQFFRFYAHEFDYDKHVLSVRQGKLLTKLEKNWHYQINNQLCVEEPFNVSRNLGNTADEYSFRGLHLELRRAFDLISEAKLSEACDQYVYPKEEEKVWTRPPQQPRPVLVRSSSQSHSGRGRGGHRGRGNYHRGSSRRASSSMPTSYENGGLMMPVGVPGDMSWYHNAHYQMQYTQQDLMAQMAYQENLRQLQLYTQPAYLQALNHQQQQQQQQRQPDRSRTNSFDNVPVTPVRPDLYALYGMTLGHFYPGYGTYPSSPVASSQEFRRPLQRTATTDNAPTSSSPRSQSQPASRSPSASQPSLQASTPRQVNGVPLPSFISDDDFDETPKAESPQSDSFAREAARDLVRDPAVDVGPALPGPNGIAFGDLGPGRRRPSTDTPQTILDRRMRRSTSPSPGHARTYSAGTSAPGSRPLVVNGSGLTMPGRARTESLSSVSSKDLTPPGVDGGSVPRPIVVNGSNTPLTPPGDDASFRDRVVMMRTYYMPQAASQEPNGGASRLSPSARQRLMSRQPQNGVIAPLDLAIGDHRMRPSVVDSAHLSPVYETRTPSPSAFRKESWLSDGSKHGYDRTTALTGSAMATNARAVDDTAAPKATDASVRSPTMAANVVENAATSALVMASASSTSVSMKEARANGHVRGAKSESDGGWQKAKAKKKTLVVAAYGEPAPKNEHERKGG